MITATYLVLVAAASGFTYRLVRGPSLADRTLALSGLVLVGMGAIATDAIDRSTGAFLPTLVVVALVGPISTGIVARFIEGRGR